MRDEEMLQLVRRDERVGGGERRPGIWLTMLPDLPALVSDMSACACIVVLCSKARVAISLSSLICG